MNVFQEYEDNWRDRLENKLWRNWMAKEKLVTLDDSILDTLIKSISEVGVEKLSVRNLLAIVKQTHPELVKEFEDLI